MFRQHVPSTYSARDERVIERVSSTENNIYIYIYKVSLCWIYTDTEFNLLPIIMSLF